MASSTANMEQRELDLGPDCIPNDPLPLAQLHLTITSLNSASNWKLSIQVPKSVGNTHSSHHNFRRRKLVRAEVSNCIRDPSFGTLSDRVGIRLHSAGFSAHALSIPCSATYSFTHHIPHQHIQRHTGMLLSMIRSPGDIQTLQNASVPVVIGYIFTT